jgi:tetratricopeptide (TPR) repeat protein
MRRPVFVLLSLLLLAPLWASELPRHSKPRAARHAAWRADLTAAERAAREGLADRSETLYRRVLRQAEECGDGSLLLARAADGLADLCRDSGRKNEARELYLRAIAVWEETLGPGQPRMAISLHNLGTVEMDLRRYEEADLHLREALRIWEVSLGPDSEEAANTRQARRVLRSKAGASLSQADP